MRRQGGLFSRLVSFENLLLAARKAQRAKRYRPEVLRFNRRLEESLVALGAELEEGSWRPSPHRHFKIFEPKPRWISAAPYGDRVVHHALCNLIEPVVDRPLIYDCWANRRGKGSHRAVLRYQRFASRYRYAFKVDIRKYFFAIDHEILGRQLGQLFKERRILALMDRIIAGVEIPSPFYAYFPGDDLFTTYDRPKGLPIGNLTSQLWANLYLSEFDHWVKRELRCRGYLRFVDDFILLSDSKKTLREWKARVAKRLGDLRLLMHPRKSVIRRTDEGVPFLGYVVWPRRIRVRGATVRRFRRRLKASSGREAEAQTVAARLEAWKGHVGLAGGWRRGLKPGAAGVREQALGGRIGGLLR